MAKATHKRNRDREREKKENGKEKSTTSIQMLKGESVLAMVQHRYMN